MADTSRVSDAGSSESLPITVDSNTNTIDTQDSRKRKAMQPRSDVWNHFDKFEVNGVGKARCRYCKQAYAANSSRNGTTGLKNHLLRCKEYPLNIDKDNSQTKINFQSCQNDEGSIWKFEPEVVRRALIEMIVIDELPFSFVENEGFMKFMRKTQPLFRLPSRRTITRDCYEVYSEMKQNLRKSFREAQPKICLTTDTWTSLQRINYMCLTAHFIDKDWKLHKRILDFCHITSHKGEEMAKVIRDCLLEWKLDKVFTITVDNASSNDVTVKELSKQLDMWKTNMMSGKHLHVRCMAHILNLIVQDGLKELDASVTRVRNVVRYVRSSPARTLKFKQCCAHVKVKCTKTLCLDVPTRWNSTYLMLDTAQKFEMAFDKFHLFDDGFSAYQCSHVCEDGSSVGPLDSDDWVNVRNVIEFLARFHELTKKVSGSRYVTCNSHFEDVFELYCHLKMCLASEDEHLRKMAERMQEKFKKYWGEPEKMNKMIFIASVLDPQYLKKYSTGSCPQSPSRSTSSSNTSNTSSGSVISASKIRTKLSLKKQKEDNGGGGAKSELDKYISEEQEPFSEDFDILSWWKTHAPRFPILSELARDVLAIPISSVASECIFSTGGRILDSFRSSLTPKCVEALTCVQDWLREENNPISVEEDLKYLEELELGSSIVVKSIMCSCVQMQFGVGQNLANFGVVYSALAFLFTGSRKLNSSCPAAASMSWLMCGNGNESFGHALFRSVKSTHILYFLFFFLTITTLAIHLGYFASLMEPFSNNFSTSSWNGLIDGKVGLSSDLPYRR
ncbi:PREDICTED: zinc finger BED domain-containing protein RICESLEEPER 2-like [Nicotiana attenuata]|nr:PREDICTED: zinc finger BED domain-containing protein RICESLEEPER 2-like [Nicotiana attenuata]